MARQRRSAGKGWMLRNAPHNEDFILAVARTKEDLEYIAGQYIEDNSNEDVDYIDADVDFKEGTVTVHFGVHEDLEGYS